MKYLCIILVWVYLLGFTLACKKNQPYDLRPILNATNDNILSQRPFNYAFTMLLRACTDSVLMEVHQAFIDGATVYLSESGKKITFLFDGDLCQDSVIRFGSFIAVLDTNLFLDGAQIQFSFLDYFEDNHHIIGDYHLENSGINRDGKIGFTSRVDSAVITKDSIHNIHWEGELLYLVDPPSMLPNPEKILITIEGKGYGMSSRGYAFQSTITGPLADSLSCPWIHDGMIQIIIQDGDVRSGTIEYMGKSGCDDRVDYNFEGRLYHLWINDKYLRN